MADLDILRDIEKDLTRTFEERRQILSFDDFFLAFCEAPQRHLRTAPQYLRDCIAHYGTEEVRIPGGATTRFRIFDAPWNGGRARVVGQEAAQGTFARLVTNFVREGRVTRLVMLHGPNGSAKSSFVECLAQGLEDYCRLDEGAIYTYNWVFPSSRVAKKKLGFGGGEVRGSLQSYALLEDEDIDARLAGDLRDHPLLLIPQPKRKALLLELREKGLLSREEPLPDYIMEGDLSPRSHAIYNALLSSYQGDVQRVLQHVQVERFFYSRRYRRGLVTIEPQLHVDASMRQLTMDQGIAALPSALKSLSLFEPFGDLVDANRGIVNYNDLLKKPIDAFKYLLATCEKGTVALSNAILHLDVVFVASSNEKHMRAFKEFSDWASFKGRMDLVKMPYIRDYRTEQAIYDEHVAHSGLGDQLVPHATYVLALWAVLTRLKRPRPELYPTTIRKVVSRLTPLEKADLYAGVRMPRELSNEQGKELRQILPDLLVEGQEEEDYEGSFGASPREMKQVLLNALQNRRFWGLSALGLLEELRELMRDRTVYDYLRREPDGGYHDYQSFIDQVMERYLDRVDAEMRGAMGLIQEQQYDELFARYIRHVSYLLKGEKLYNEGTSSYDEPDVQLMKRLEGVWDVSGDPMVFRRDLVSRVGAWRIEHRDEKIDYRKLFTKLFESLETEYFTAQRAKVRKMCEHLATLLIADQQGENPMHHGLSAAEVERAREVLATLETDFGYRVEPLREIFGALLRQRY